MTYKEYASVESVVNSSRLSMLCNLAQNVPITDFPIFEVSKETFEIIRASTTVIDISEDFSNSLYDFFGTFVRLKIK